MALAKALDNCFAKVHVPHVLDLIYRYAFDVEPAMSDYGGIPYDIYRQLTQEITEIVKNTYGTYYRVNNKLHRLDGPATVHSCGTMYYHINDKLHRLDGPAVIGSSGSVKYFINGQRHRLDGPAIVGANGYEEYWVNGKPHKLDGPAVTYDGGRKKYYIEGVRYSLSEFNAEVERRKLLEAKSSLTA